MVFISRKLTPSNCKCFVNADIFESVEHCPLTRLEISLNHDIITIPIYIIYNYTNRPLKHQIVNIDDFKH